ncbi:MAG: hypothetical protein IT461_12615 [Planctomycetes bacterium]|nr:hypothetical protein [Planctomycetota bacterium]
MSLPFETELVVRGVDAVDALKRNLSLFPKTGLWPIILGGPRDLEWIEESRDLARDEDGLDPIQVMEDSRVFDVENWLANCEADRNLSDPEVMGKWPWFPRPND